MGPHARHCRLPLRRQTPGYQLRIHILRVWGNVHGHYRRCWSYRMGLWTDQLPLHRDWLRGGGAVFADSVFDVEDQGREGAETPSGDEQCVFDGVSIEITLLIAGIYQK